MDHRVGIHIRKRMGIRMNTYTNTNTYTYTYMYTYTYTDTYPDTNTNTYTYTYTYTLCKLKDYGLMFYKSVQTTYPFQIYPFKNTHLKAKVSIQKIQL